MFGIHELTILTKPQQELDVLVDGGRFGNALKEYDKKFKKGE